MKRFLALLAVLVTVHVPSAFAADLSDLIAAIHDAQNTAAAAAQPVQTISQAMPALTQQATELRSQLSGLDLQMLNTEVTEAMNGLEEFGLAIEQHRRNAPQNLVLDNGGSVPAQY